MTTDKDGNRFEGFFKNGKRNGVGKEIHVNGQSKLQRYKNGKIVS